MKRKPPISPFRILFFVLPLVALIALLKVIHLVFIIGDNSLDNSLLTIISPYINDTNTSIMVFFTTLGNYEIVLTGNVILFLFLMLVKKEPVMAIKLALISLSAVLMMYVLKDFFGRPRPDIPLIDHAVGYSFPSGHSLNSVVFYGVLVYVCNYYIQNKTLKYLVSTLLIITIFLIGFSRIYINVHYLTDVIAGFSIGVIWLFLSLGTITYFKNSIKIVIK